MRILKIALATLLLGALALPLVSCGSQSDTAEPPGNQVATAQRGDLVIAITGVGNLALSRTEDLAIDLFYPTGTKAAIGEVLVEEGDTVVVGQELVKLDTFEWNDELETIEDGVTSAERQLTAKQLALLQAEINLKNAKIALEDAEALYIWPADVFAARQAVWNAESALEDAQDTLKGEKLVYDRTTGQYILKEVRTTADIEYWIQKVADTEETLSAARLRLDNLLAQVAGDTEAVAVKRLQFELAEGNVEDAKEAIEVTRKAAEDAQEDLDEARSKSPIITAPFDGFITNVNVEGGDEVLNGTVAVQIADPNKFEAEVMVSEMDILQMKLGGEATVQVDAMQGLSLPAEVTHISPTATIQAGVVNYTVKVEIQSEEMKKEFQQGQERPQGQVSAAIPEDFQLREGLTVTVSIVVDARYDVLLIPNAAITKQGIESSVQVVSPDGITEERAIKTGISDWQFTEVTDGLSEGENVVVPEGTAVTTPATQSQRPQGGTRTPGMGGAHP